MIVIDAHLDLAWNALDWNRDLLRPVEEIRRREREQRMSDKARGSSTVSFPELRRGKVAIFIATLRGAGINVKVRKRKGSEIDAACGQLRRRVEAGGS